MARYNNLLAHGFHPTHSSLRERREERWERVDVWERGGERGGEGRGCTQRGGNFSRCNVEINLTLMAARCNNLLAHGFQPTHSSLGEMRDERGEMGESRCFEGGGGRGDGGGGGEGVSREEVIIPGVT